MKLSKRLNSAYNMVEPNTGVIDVGCDHGLLGLNLLKNNKISSLICSDISANALQSCRDNANKMNLKPVFKVTDGLKGIDLSTIETIIITGLGGNNIIDILNQVDISHKSLIISPQSNEFKVRRFLTKKGFKLIREECVSERGKYYFIMKWVYQKSRLSFIKQYYSTLVFKPNQEYLNYLKMNKQKLIKMNKNIPLKSINKKMIISIKICFLSIIIFFI